MPEGAKPGRQPKEDKSKETRHAAARKGVPMPPPEKRTFQGGKQEKKG